MEKSLSKQQQELEALLEKEARITWKDKAKNVWKNVTYNHLLYGSLGLFVGSIAAFAYTFNLCGERDPYQEAEIYVQTLQHVYELPLEMVDFSEGVLEPVRRLITEGARDTDTEAANATLENMTAHEALLSGNGSVSK